MERQPTYHEWHSFALANAGEVQSSSSFGTFDSEANVDTSLKEIYLNKRNAFISPLKATTRTLLTAPFIQGSPFRYQAGSGRIPSPRMSRTSPLVRRVVRTCLTTELESRSWFVANATNPAHPAIPKTPNASNGTKRFYIRSSDISSSVHKVSLNLQSGQVTISRTRIVCAWAGRGCERFGRRLLRWWRSGKFMILCTAVSASSWPQRWEPPDHRWRG